MSTLEPSSLGEDNNGNPEISKRASTQTVPYLGGIRVLGLPSSAGDREEELGLLLVHFHGMQVSFLFLGQSTPEEELKNGDVLY